ncbi:MAG: hypothetical protein WD648_02910 [Planctomycetaceae bacterium]
MERLQQYRFLAIVCGLAILAGAWEFIKSREHSSTVNPVKTGAPQVPDVPPDRKVFGEVFPQTPNAEFDRGMELYAAKDYPQAMAHFRKALATGVKTHEDLLWYNVLTLLRLKADEAEIDAAVDNWRHNFPHSGKQDPFWFYALSLVTERGDPRDIQAAVSLWRKKSPDSLLPNPLEARR